MINHKFRIFALIGILSIGACAQTSKVDRSKKPKPGEPPDINIGDYEKLTLDNGMKVFIVKDTQSPKVTYKFEIDRKPILEGKKAGYLSLAGDMLGTATENRSKKALNEDIDYLGADFSTSSKGLYASALKKHNDYLLNIATDVLQNPVFKKKEFEKAKKQMLSGLQASKNQPDAIASRVFDRLLFSKNHPYGDVRTQETVNNVKLKAIKRYYKKYLNPSNLYLSVVGPVKKDKLIPLIRELFEDWKPDNGQTKDKKFKNPELPSKNQVAVVNRSDASQSTLRIGNPVKLTRKDDDYFAARIANTILGGRNFRLYMNLREKHAYTYGAYSRLSADPLIGTFKASANVENNATDSAINQILKEMRKMRNKKVDSQELERAKNYLTGNFAINLEDPRTLAEYAINKAKYNLPKDFYQNYLNKLNQVTLEEVRKAAKKYFRPDKAQILVVGKSSEFRGKLQKFGEVNYYDKFGRPVEGPGDLKVPEDMTAEKVINKYIKARGGAKKLNQLEGYALTYQTTIRSRTLKINLKKKSPNLFRQNLKVGGMTQQEKVYDGKQAFVKSMQTGKKKLEGKQEKQTRINATMFYLTKMDELGLNAELKGMETINNKPAYKIKLSNDEGLSWIEYFSKYTHLRVAEKRTQKTPQGEMTQTTFYSDYETKDGIKFPGTITQSMGQRKFDLDLLVINLNPGLSKSDFKLKSN